MSEKMTGKEVADALSWLHSKEGHFNEAGKLRAHITALTAELDEARREREQFRDDLVRASEFAHQGGTGSPVTQEGRDAIESIARQMGKSDALRERVTALEAKAVHFEKVAKGADLNWLTACERANVAESRLATIRQRAGDAQALAKVAAASRWDSLSDWAKGRFMDDACAVARHVLGDDAQAPCGNCEGVQPETCATHPPSEMSGLEGEMVESRLPESDTAPLRLPTDAPTTAEAFEGVRESMEACTGVHNDGARLLSLLERRMGAQEAAARRLIRDAERPDTLPETTNEHGERMVRVQWSLVETLRAALTDAPPVFTLEEKDVSALSAGAAFLRTLHKHIHRRLEQSNKEGLHCWAEKLQKMADALRR